MRQSGTPAALIAAGSRSLTSRIHLRSLHFQSVSRRQPHTQSRYVSPPLTPIRVAASASPRANCPTHKDSPIPVRIQRAARRTVGRVWVPSCPCGRVEPRSVGAQAVPRCARGDTPSPVRTRNAWCRVSGRRGFGSGFRCTSCRRVARRPTSSWPPPKTIVSGRHLERFPGQGEGSSLRGVRSLRGQDARRADNSPCAGSTVASRYMREKVSSRQTTSRSV